MDAFWHEVGGFARDFWWLIFVIGPAVGGMAKAFERASKRRHERRLEVIRAKAEIAAAKAAARQPRSARANTEAGRDIESSQTQLERLLAAHDALTHRWLEYELDVAKLIAFPTMSDGRWPLTAAFLRAKRIADGRRPASASVRIGPDDLTAYRDALTDAEVAFDVAEQDARRQRDRSFSEPERRRLATAKRLLNVAVDEAATPAERRSAYERVRAELDGLIAVSDEALTQLAEKAALQLPPTAS